MGNNDVLPVKLPIKIDECIGETARRIASFKSDDFVSDGLYRASTHLLNDNAKLLRPMLVFSGAVSVGEDPGKYIDLAAGIELLHTASLIHDDIIDKDTKRREVETVHLKYGISAAILAGDALIAKGIQLAAKYGPRMMESISRAAMDMCAGELLDLACQEQRRVPSMDEYLNIVWLKTGSLIASSCSMAAEHKEDPDSKHLYEFGRALGYAFQTRDDIMDYEKGGLIGPEMFRPNIVSVIGKDKSLESEGAIDAAVELNNGYMKDTKARLNAMRNKSAFGPYIDYVSVERFISQR